MKIVDGDFAEEKTFIFDKPDDNVQCKIHFKLDFLNEERFPGRQFTTCIIESLTHKTILAGVAIVSPKDNEDILLGWKISLQRACSSYPKIMYKTLWHEIRLALRKEKENEQGRN